MIQRELSKSRFCASPPLTVILHFFKQSNNKPLGSISVFWFLFLQAFTISKAAKSNKIIESVSENTWSF